MLSEKKQIEYFHFESPENGNRYFRVDWLNEKVIQIVLHSGKAKIGRPHQIGITSLAMSSFRGTYHHYYFKNKKKYEIKSVLKHTTENQFSKALEECFKLLHL